MEGLVVTPHLVVAKWSSLRRDNRAKMRKYASMGSISHRVGRKLIEYRTNWDIAAQFPHPCVKRKRGSNVLKRNELLSVNARSIGG